MSIATDTIAFSRGVPPIEAVPVDELVRHTEAALAAAPGAMFQYAPIGSHRGDARLRELLADRHGEPDPDAVFVGNGSLQVLDMLAAHLLGGDRPEVWVEAPTYDRALHIFARHGARVVALPLQEDGIDIDAVGMRLGRRVPAFLYTIPDFQNPSGVTMCEPKRRALVRLATEHGFRIVEDIPYRELRFCGTAPPTLRELSAGSVITIGSLSKTVSAGLRVGYAVADADTTLALASRAADTYLSPVPLCQAVAARCLESRLLERSAAQACTVLAPRHDAAVESVLHELGDVLMTVPGGGYFLAIQLPIEADEAALLDAARSVGVMLTAGSGFYPATAPRRPREAFVRLPFQALAPERFAEGVRRLVLAAMHVAPRSWRSRVRRKEVIP